MSLVSVSAPVRARPASARAASRRTFRSLNGASVGQPVQVLNPVSRKILYGTALPSGAVAVTTTIAVAGL